MYYDRSRVSTASSATSAPSLEITHLVRDTCLCLRTHRAARTLARRFDQAFRPLGLTNGQFSLLMSLNRPAPASMRSVSSLLAMDRTTLTAALKPLERRGLVASVGDPSDRRSRLVQLTAAGRSLLARAVPIWQRTHAQVEGPLSESERRRLLKLLDSLAR